MQLGFVTAILPDQSFEEVLRFAAQEGYDCIEVMCWPPGKAERKFAGVSHIDVVDFTQSKADDVRGLCEKHGVGISALGYYPNPLSDDAEEAQIALGHLRKVIDAAPLLGLNTVNTFIGADHQLPLETNFAKFEKVWPDVVRHAESRGVRIGVENCPMLFTADEWPFGKNLARSPAVWRRMFDTIGSDALGLNYDPSHMVLQMMDYIAPIYEFRDRMFHVHAKDMRIERDQLDAKGVWDLGYAWCTPKIPGLGDVDWNRFVSALTDIGYDGPVCVEVEDESFSANLAQRQRSLTLSQRILRPLVG